MKGKGKNMRMRGFYGKWRNKNEVSFGRGERGKMVFAAVFWL